MSLLGDGWVEPTAGMKLLDSAVLRTAIYLEKEEKSNKIAKFNKMTKRFQTLRRDAHSMYVFCNCFNIGF